MQTSALLRLLVSIFDSLSVSITTSSSLDHYRLRQFIKYFFDKSENVKLLDPLLLDLTITMIEYIHPWAPQIQRPL